MTPEQRKAARLISSRMWRESNADKMNKAREDWIKSNPHKVKERTRRYQVKKKSAIPGWASKEAMAIVYQEAAIRTKETGIRHDVDHIVPITSKLVCGLHCEANLQVLPITENRRKHNRYWPEMPT